MHPTDVDVNIFAAYKTNPHERMRSQMYEHILGPAKIAHQTDTADQVERKSTKRTIVSALVTMAQIARGKIVVSDD